MREDLSIKNTATIHQPHFLPWFPYLARIAAAENYVVLDDVQFRRKFYQDRTVLITPNNRHFHLKVHVIAKATSKIEDVFISKDAAEFGRITKTIFYNYKKAKFFDEIWPALIVIFERAWEKENLATMNVCLMEGILDIIGVKKPKIIYSSALAAAPDRSVRIIDICSKLNVKNLLCGWGATTMIHNNDLIRDGNISLYTLDIKYVTEVLSDYVLYEGLSIVDALMHLGADATRKASGLISQYYAKNIWR